MNSLHDDKILSNSFRIQSVNLQNKFVWDLAASGVGEGKHAAIFRRSAAESGTGSSRRSFCDH